VPVDLAAEIGDLHEARPITSARDVFWQHDPAATERCIRAVAAGYIVLHAIICRLTDAPDISGLGM